MACFLGSAVAPAESKSLIHIVTVLYRDRALRMDWLVSCATDVRLSPRDLPTVHTAP